jgi:hypothetical protein
MNEVDQLNVFHAREHFAVSIYHPARCLTGEGKGVVSERPRCGHVGTGTKISSAQPQLKLIPDQLISCPGLRPFVAVAQRGAGALMWEMGGGWFGGICV